MGEDGNGVKVNTARIDDMRRRQDAAEERTTRVVKELHDKIDFNNREIHSKIDRNRKETSQEMKGLGESMTAAHTKLNEKVTSVREDLGMDIGEVRTCLETHRVETSGALGKVTESIDNVSKSISKFQWMLITLTGTIIAGVIIGLILYFVTGQQQ